MSLEDTIKKAHIGVRKMKEHSPYLFPEWHHLNWAKENLKKAEEDVKRAQAAWDNR